MRQTCADTECIMNTIEYRLGNATAAHAEGGFSITSSLRGADSSRAYDTDLLYVECRFCGKPLLWEAGKTRLLVRASGIDETCLDAECMIISDGCPNCSPGASLFHMHVVRLTPLAPQDLLLLGDHKGSA